MEYVANLCLSALVVSLTVLPATEPTDEIFLYIGSVCLKVIQFLVLESSPVWKRECLKLALSTCVRKLGFVEFNMNNRNRLGYI